MVNRPNRDTRNKKSSGFNYRPPSDDAVKRMANAKGGRMDTIFKSGFDTWRAKEGDNQIRILPPTWDNQGHYAYEVWVHANIGDDGSMYLCPRLNKDPKTGNKMNKPCAICDAAKRAKADGDADEAKELSAISKYACWMIDRDDDSEQAQLYLMSWTQNRDLLSLCVNKRSGKVLHIAQPEEGFDVLVKRNGTGLKTKYILAIERDASYISDSDKVMEELKEFTEENPVPATLDFKSNEYLKQAISGTGGEEDEELNDDTGEDDRRRPARGSRRGRDDEGDADGETRTGRRGSKRDSEDNNEEEEARTSRRGRRGDDEGDNGEEEQPRRGRGSRRDEEEEPRQRRNTRKDESEDDTDNGDGDGDNTDGEGDNGEEEAPRGRRGRGRDEEEAPRSRRSRRDEEEESNTDGEGEGEEDTGGEEEQPRRSRGRRDEEEERPRSRRSSREEEEPRSRRDRDSGGRSSGGSVKRTRLDDEPRGRRNSREEEPRRRTGSRR